MPLDPPNGTLIALSNVSLSISDREIIGKISLSIKEGNILGIVGPSGCGKTSLLRIMALLQRPTSGSIELLGSPVGMSVNQPSLHPLITMLQQTFPLFPRMSTLQTLKILRHADMGTAVQVAQELGVFDLFDRKPDALSLGQRQRLAFVRTIATRPKILLLDEPTSALDEAGATKLLSIVRRYVETTKSCAALVTHNKLLAEEFSNGWLKMGESP